MVWHEFMGKRGPKPISVGLLSTWEFEFYKALHLLRDGIALPRKNGLSTGLTAPELRTFITRLKRMSPEHYWLTTQRVGVELGEALNLNRRPVRMDLLWAERERDEEAYWLERELNPPSIRARARRRKLWSDLVRANTYASLRKVCGRWARLPDVWRPGRTPFPRHVLESAAKFFLMKRNRRFPQSNYSDDSRLEYLARGMAGAVCGVSPMTAIERLRNMKHDRGGPLWVTRQGDYILPEAEQYCACWRCSIKRSNKVTAVTQTWYENGLKLFMELSLTTKVPTEWMRKTLT